jgi:SAM-dependent methyltransferase
MTTENYDKAFYNAQVEGALFSARQIVPILRRHYSFNSVVDVGCGMGAWLKAFQDEGVSQFLGLDGRYIDQSALLVPPQHFKPCDLENPPKLKKTFDLACSLEVAEHLPPAFAPEFVNYLVQQAPVVLFSAAIPGQSGTHHVNCQWQSWWAKLFADRGYAAYDFIRPLIQDRKDIEYWYRQNILVYAAKGVLGEPAELSPFALDHVCPELMEELLAPPKSARLAIDDMKRSASVVYRAAVRRLTAHSHHP